MCPSVSMLDFKKKNVIDSYAYAIYRSTESIMGKKPYVHKDESELRAVYHSSPEAQSGQTLGRSRDMKACSICLYGSSTVRAWLWCPVLQKSQTSQENLNESSGSWAEGSVFGQNLLVDSCHVWLLEWKSAKCLHPSHCWLPKLVTARQSRDS